MDEWKDATSYSRDDKNRVPTAWEIKIEDVRIYVTCGHIHYPGIWIMHCNYFNINSKTLGVNTAEEAQEKALSIVLQRIERLYHALKQPN